MPFSVRKSHIASLLLTLIAGCGSLLAADSSAPATAPASQPAAPQIAAYRWAAQPQNVDAFAQWLGVDTVWGEEFMAHEKWDSFHYPDWFMGTWSKWVQAKEGRRLILGVPILPGAWDRSGPSGGMDAKKPVSLAAGARGEYNGHYKALAAKLVQYKLGNSILRLGWEFNGGWYTWRAAGQEKDWVEYWKQIVTTMRAVPGAEKLEFCWNPTQSWLQFPADKAYPGDDYVDYVGIDSYDQSWAKDTYPFPEGATPEQILARQKKAWYDVILNGTHGLKFWVDFAKKHNKPFALPEWGLCRRPDKHGGLDNVFYIEQMHQFINDPANNVAWHCYFDVQAPDVAHQVSPGLKGNEKTEFPKASARFRELFGKQK